MAGKRKRNRPGRENGVNKRQRISGGFDPKDPVIKQAVLAQYYVKVVSLRDYLLSKLPASSKIRRKKILLVKQENTNEEDDFANFLDQVIIGVSSQQEISTKERIQHLATFSQRIDTSDIGNTSGIGGFSQSEVRFNPIYPIYKSRTSLTNMLDCRFRHLVAFPETKRPKSLGATSSMSRF